MNTGRKLTIVHQGRWLNQPLEIVDDGPFRFLHFGSHLRQSCMVRAKPHHLILPYTRHMMACLLFIPDPRKILMVGLGGGSMAKFLLRLLPRAEMAVVEIIPEMADLCRRYFHLPDEPRLTIHVDDGGLFLERNAQRELTGRMDLILVDAYDREGMASTVYARAFFQHCRRIMTPQGVMAINLTRNNLGSYRRATRAISENFPRRNTMLTYAGSNNIIVFAWNDPQPVDRDTLRARAAVLDQETGLELTPLAGRLADQPASIWRRLLRF